MSWTEWEITTKKLTSFQCLNPVAMFYRITNMRNVLINTSFCWSCTRTTQYVKRVTGMTTDANSWLCHRQARREPQRGRGNILAGPLWGKVYFLNGAFWCTLYFWAMSGPRDAAGSEVACPLYPSLDCPGRRTVTIMIEWQQNNL